MERRQAVGWRGGELKDGEEASCRMERGELKDGEETSCTSTGPTESPFGITSWDSFMSLP